MRLLALGALNLFLLSASEAFVSSPSYLSQSASTSTARERRKPETSSTTLVNPSTSVSYPSNTSLQSTTDWNELKQQKIRLTQQSNRNHMAQTIKACKVLNFHPKMQFSKSGVVLDLDMKFVKKAYRQMALTHHPDYLLSNDATEEERQAANDRFAKINQAYTFLTSTKRYYHQDLNENGQVKVIQRKQIQDRATQSFGHDPSVPFLTRVNQKYQERNQKVVKGNIASEKTAASPNFVASVKKAVNPRDQHIFSEMREQDRRMVVNPTQPTQPLVPKRVLHQKIQTFKDGNDMAVENLDDGASPEMVGNHDLDGIQATLEHPQAEVEPVADIKQELGDKEKEEATLQIAQVQAETNMNEQRDESLLQVPYNQVESMTVEENQFEEQKEKMPLQIPYNPMETINGVENKSEIEQKEQATLQVTQNSSLSNLGDMNQPGEQNNQVPMQFPHDQVRAEATTNIPHNQVGADVTANISQNQVGADVTANISQNQVGADVTANISQNQVGADVTANISQNQVGADVTANISQNQVGAEVIANIPQNQVGADVTANIPQNQVGAEVTANIPQNQVAADVTANISQNQVGADVTANIPQNQVGADVTANIPQSGVKFVDGGNYQSSEQNANVQVGVQVPQEQSEAMENMIVQQKKEDTAEVENNTNKINNDEQKHSQFTQFPEQQLYRVVNYVEIQEPAEEEQKDEQGLVIQWKKTRKSSIDEKRNTARKEDNSQTSNYTGTKVNFQLEAIDKKEIDDMASPDLLRIEQELPATTELSSVDDTLILSWLKDNEIEEEAEKRMKFASRKECLLHYIKKKNSLPQVGTTKSSPAGMMQKRLEDAMAESNVSNISQDDISKLSLNLGSQEGRHGTSNSAAPSVSQNTMTGNQKPRKIEVVRRQVNVVERKTNAITPVESANRPRLNVNDSPSHKQVNRAASISPTESANRPRLNVNEVRSKSVNESANRPRLNVNEVRSKSSKISNSSSVSNQRSNHMRPQQIVSKANKGTMNWTTDDASITPKNDSVARPPPLNRKVEVTRNSTPQNNGAMNPVPSQASKSTTVINNAARVQQRRVEVPRTVQNNNQVQSPMRTSSPSPSSATKPTKQSNAGWGSTDISRSLKQEGLKREVSTVDDGNKKLVPNAVKKHTPNSIHSHQENAVKPKKDTVQFPAYPKKELLQNAVKRKVAASSMLGKNNKVELPAYPKNVATTSNKTNEPKSKTAPVSSQRVKQTVTAQAKEQNPYLRTPEEEEELKRLRENVVWTWSTTSDLDTKARR